MAKLRHISGVENILRNLAKVKNVDAANVAHGLKKGGLFLLRESSEIVPVQLGNLKGSGFCRNVGGSGFETDIVVGFTANYAVYVHENLEAAHGVEFNIKHAAEIAVASGTPQGTAKGGMFERGETQQAKFLERPAREKRRDIIRIIAKEAKR